MDDLISELHEWTQDLDIQDCGADGVLFRAIDRIEQLEAALRKINARLNDSDSWLAQSIDCRNIAEATLEEKKDGN
jgi:hypothetical protein